MQTPEILRSSALRAAAGIALATSGATLLIFAFVYWQITSLDYSSVRHILADEAEKSVNETEPELRRALDLRLTRDLRRLDYAALFDASGTILVGNIDAMPSIPVDGKPYIVAAVRPPGDAMREEPAIFVARARQDGGVLVLGRSLIEIYELQRTVLWALASASLPALALALGIGAVAARRTSRRLTQIHVTIAKIMKGDLHARLPEQKSQDEIDRVSRDVNVMLDEIVRLVSQIKSVGDNIAHDLRTPISVVRAKLERGAADPDDAALRRSVKQALAELDRAMVTIAALLRLAEFENTPRSTGFAPIDLAEICGDLFEFYEPLAREKSIAMTLEATPPAPAMGDRDLIREALANIIDNAIKFTDPGGSVRISAAMEAGRPMVRICDSGSGVAPKDRITIFDRFYRTGAADKVQGHGLGLSIAAAIANLHDFDLRVEDNRPGSIFQLSPRAPGVKLAYPEETL